MNRTYPTVEEPDICRNSTDTREEPIPVCIAAPLAKVLERLQARLDADERRGLEAEGDREAPADA